MQKITPHLWFDTQAKEAAEFYTAIFPNSRIKNTTTLHNTPSGSVDIVTLDLQDQEFTFLSAGPLFTFTPAISFIVSCETSAEVDRMWEALSKDGKVLMEIGEYPFSKRYGWIQDRFGVSWQIMLTDTAPIKQKITPTLLFVGEKCGKAEEAITLYTSTFHNAHVGEIARYGADELPDKEGSLKYASFTLEGQEFAAMDSAYAHDFTFNESISFIVHCENQEEIDYYWSALSADPTAEQCGWIKDKYGVSWQIVPVEMDIMLENADKETMVRVTEAFLKMKKFDIEALKRAYENK